MSQEIRRDIYNILMDNSRKKSDCVTAMSLSIDSDPSDTIPIARAQLEHWVKHRKLRLQID